MAICLYVANQVSELVQADKLHDELHWKTNGQIHLLSTIEKNSVMPSSVKKPTL